MTAQTTSAEPHEPPSINLQSRNKSPSISSFSSTSSTQQTPPSLSTLPSGNQSLSGISLRAFLLGTTLGLTTSLTLYTALQPSPTWRIPFFITSLSLFHFLEFFITARYNTSQAFISSFLLSSNGWAYNAAHGSALLECLITLYFFPNHPLRTGSSLSVLCLGMGLCLMGVGQVVRSLAMAHAAGNFNHHVQSRRKDGHVLVTDGIYAVLRHPSYFGFFWWGLGTQMVLGNFVCFVLYALVLWRFFAKRIEREESFLISFFGDDYVQYRRNTLVGIPGIP